MQAAYHWLDDNTEEILYGGAKGGGKSYLGCSLIFGDALTYPGTHYFIARHDLNDLKKFTTPSIYEVFENWKVDHRNYMRYNGQDNYFILNNGSRVYYLDCKHIPSDPDYHRFGSMQFTRGWAEEIGQIHSLAIANLAVSIGRWKNIEYDLKRKMLMTCNPNKGYAYQNFYLPNKKGQLDEVRKFVPALPTDNKYLTPEYLKALERLPDNEKQRLRFGNWEYDDDPTVMIDYTTIQNMYSNIFVESEQMYIIADIARYGSDRAIITVWDGLKLIHYVTFQISSTVTIQNAINALRMKYKVKISNTLVDEDGIGGGIVDTLNCQGFVNNSKAYNGNYQNLKSECGYKLAELAPQTYINVSLPDSEIEKINQELGMLKTFDSDKDGKLRIYPKAKIKDEIGRSPDWLDVFIMRMYYFVGRKEFTLV